MNNERSKEIFTKNINIFTLAVIATMLWGSAYPSVKIGYELFNIASVDTYGKILLAGYRFLIAGVLTILITSVIRRKFVYPAKKNIVGIGLLGLIQTSLQYIFFYIGLSNTTGVKGAILNSTGTFIVVILAHFIYKNDKLNVQKTIGCLVGFIGVFIINIGGNTSGSGFSFTGEGFMMLAAATFAIGSIISKAVAKNEDSMVMTGYQLSIGGTVLVVIGFIGGGNLATPSPSAIILLLYMAVLSSVAFTIWAVLLKYNRVGKITIYNFLVPVFGTILSALYLQESIYSLKNIIALICVCLGIYIVNRSKKGLAL
ncbi:DMT family transporter [Clostridium vincentii]|uniref:Putative DMT superfamily transporter inner membrane protein n=1 Tax=Clostridium vincentii TaxID=52704 RepID=A0A2T0B907_9CLOT|nr:DMT family transporter [Clostridium vincentii]PRR80378.1 putative DMT superfamily transporter inner membrane protein [Clostridium vincentii]